MIKDGHYEQQQQQPSCGGRSNGSSGSSGRSSSSSSIIAAHSTIPCLLSPPSHPLFHSLLLFPPPSLPQIKVLSPRIKSLTIHCSSDFDFLYVKQAFFSSSSSSWSSLTTLHITSHHLPAFLHMAITSYPSSLATVRVLGGVATTCLSQVRMEEGGRGKERREREREKEEDVVVLYH